MQTTTEQDSSSNNRLAYLSKSALDKWSELPYRDRVALIFLTVFLIIFIVGYGGYSVFNSAKNQKESYKSNINDYFWLRSQATNINPVKSSDQLEPLNQRATQILAQGGAKNSQVLVAGDSVQLSFEHDSQVTASNIIGAMINSGMKIQQLTMQQEENTKTIRVQATVLQ